MCGSHAHIITRTNSKPNAPNHHETRHSKSPFYQSNSSSLLLYKHSICTHSLSIKDLIIKVMMKMKVLLLCFISTTLMMLLLSVSNAKAAGKPVMACNPLELSSCADAILSGANPSATCCAKLKQQQPCFCEYVKKPNLKGYINSKNGRKVADTCKVPIPRCP